MNIIFLDKDLFLLINGFVGSVPVFDNLIELVVNEYFVPATLAFAILYLWFSPGRFKEKNQEALSNSVFSIVLVALLIAISNQFIIRARPFEQLSTNLLFYKPTDPSFPSNAAAVGFVLATAAFLANRRLGTVALILAVLYAFSRVYAGVHYPSDVVSGAILGVAATIAVNRLTPMKKFLTSLGQNAQKRFKLDLD